jgi:transcriptional regulator with XRE-family HTH domain
MDLGKAIKDIRIQKGIKQNVFAKKCRITQTYLSQIESNAKEPHISVLKKIADNLDVPLPILFFLSLSKEDIKPEKRKAYDMLAPSVKSLINEFFTNASHK